MISLLASLKRLTNPSAMTLRGRRDKKVALSFESGSRPIVIKSRRATLWRIAEDEHEDEASDEAAHVSHIGHAAAFIRRRARNRTKAAQELQHSPKADDDQSREFSNLTEEAERDEHAHTLMRKQDQIRGEHTRNRARSAEVGDHRVWIHKDLRGAGRKAAEQIK